MVKRLDKDDFTRLVLQNQTAMFRTARAIVSTDEDAEDAVQSAICTAFTKLDALRDPAKFKSWILRIVVNNCYDLCRKYRPITDLSEVQDFLPADDPDPTERLSLWEAVLSLNPEMRSVVTLFYYDGFSIREISRVLGISDVAVKTRLSRSRKQLRLLLADEQGGVYGLCRSGVPNLRGSGRKFPTASATPLGNMGRSSACAVHHNSKRIPLSCGSDGGDPWAGGVGESGHLPKLRLQ